MPCLWHLLYLLPGRVPSRAPHPLREVDGAVNGPDLVRAGGCRSGPWRRDRGVRSRDVPFRMSRCWHTVNRQTVSHHIIFPLFFNFNLASFLAVSRPFYFSIWRHLSLTFLLSTKRTINNRHFRDSSMVPQGGCSRSIHPDQGCGYSSRFHQAAPAG